MPSELQELGYTKTNASRYLATIREFISDPTYDNYMQVLNSKESWQLPCFFIDFRDTMMNYHSCDTCPLLLRRSSEYCCMGRDIMFQHVFERHSGEILLALIHFAEVLESKL